MNSKKGKFEVKMEKVEKLMRVFTHDLRNPLLNIQALVQDLESSVSDSKNMDEDTKETLEMLRQTTNRMDDMIVGTNEIYHCLFDDLEEENVDMHDMFLRCFAKLKLAEEGISLKCAAMHEVFADPLVVQRIVLEILSNAQKAMAACAADAEKCIQVQGSVEDDKIRFQVKDTGCGFDKYEINRVFEPFFSGQNFSYGTGLGLSRAEAWVEHHGGNMHVEMSQGHTVVSFSLPKRKNLTQ